MGSVKDLIRSGGVRSVFQPIVSLVDGTVYGYEVLSRGIPPFESPLAMFSAAESEGATWDLERACRLSAMWAVSQLPRPLRERAFFINVSPKVLKDPRFQRGFTLSQLKAYGLNQENFVLEITEHSSDGDRDRLAMMTEHYASQGFRIALDDFGSGDSGLVTLVRCTPHFIKLDMEIVRGIGASGYRRRLVKALVYFAMGVDARIIAEGVEDVEDLKALMELNVPMAQGFLFGRPSPDAPLREDEIAARLAGLIGT
ncbi:MAG: EAL domain-containing protein [Thermanaerothrix sp.]|nr:EAL domain-containing protein [Thermanaerothrix sp.]